jgi:hypothetical protein
MMGIFFNLPLGTNSRFSRWRSIMSIEQQQSVPHTFDDDSL